MIKLGLKMPSSETISSRQNPRLVHARSVRDGREPSLIFVEGVRLVEEAVRSGIEIVEVFAADDLINWDRFPELEHLAVRVKRSIFQSISATQNSQGLIAVARRPARIFSALKTSLETATIPCLVYLSSANNPSNIGAIVRTAEAAGAACVVTSKGSADAFSTKALRASMGSAFRLPIVEGVELNELRKLEGLSITAVDIGGTKNYLELDWKKPRALVFGSEAHGLSDHDLTTADERISIEMNPSVESLNLAVSAGVILFEARRSIT